MKVYSSILELVGNTPLLRLKGVEEKFNLNSRVYAKLESFNPAGSIKDRVAINIIESAEKSGKLKKGATVIETTSGNTGIGLALACLIKGYKLIITMPENMSVERQKILRAYGAEVVLTDKSLGMQGAIKKAEEIEKNTKNSFMACQFENPDNSLAHYNTTAVEIFNALNGKVDVFVSAVGTGGTLSGTSKYLKEKINGVKTVAVEPKNSAVISGEPSGAHKIQGIGAGFIPKTLDLQVVDDVVKVSDDDAFSFSKLVAKSDGVLVGISSGAALYGAVKYITDNNLTDKNVVVIFPDGYEKYLSTEIFD